jgi:cobyrinic acid a,c-diamide synthase
MMALGERLTTQDGTTREMAGVLPVSVTMRERYQALDHVELRASEATPVADRSDRLRGHEFHYSAASVDSDARFAFDVVRGTGIDGDHDGCREYRTIGTYAHVHAASGAFDAFVDDLEP